MATTFNKAETALFLSTGDFWLATSNSGDLDTKLGQLIEAAEDEVPANLYGTMPDDTVVAIGSSPRRPRKS